MVVNEQGERCCLLSLEISSPDKLYCFIAWHLFLCEFLTFLIHEEIFS